MKDFLLEKFKNYSQTTVDEFAESIVRGLPAFSNPAVDAQNADNPPIWGIEADGVWYVDKVGGKYFCNNGEIYIINVGYTKSYVDIYKEVYANLTMAPYRARGSVEPAVRILELLEYYQDTFGVENHVCGFASTDLITTIKFKTPTGQYGDTVQVMYFENYNDTEDQYLDSTIHQHVGNEMHEEPQWHGRPLTLNDAGEPVPPEFLSEIQRGEDGRWRRVGVSEDKIVHVKDIVAPAFNTDYWLDYIDEITIILRILKDKGHPFPVSIISYIDRLRDEHGFFFTDIPYFSLNSTIAINTYINTLLNVIPFRMFGTVNPDKFTILNHARKQWLPLQT